MGSEPGLHICPAKIDSEFRTCGQDHAFLCQVRDELALAIAEVSQKCEANVRLLGSLKDAMRAQVSSRHVHSPISLKHVHSPSSFEVQLDKHVASMCRASSTDGERAGSWPLEFCSPIRGDASERVPAC